MSPLTLSVGTSKWDSGQNPTLQQAKEAPPCWKVPAGNESFIASCGVRHLTAGRGRELVQHMECPPRSLLRLRIHRVSPGRGREGFSGSEGKGRIFTPLPPPQKPLPVKAAKPK